MPNNAIAMKKCNDRREPGRDGQILKDHRPVGQRN